MVNKVCVDKARGSVEWFIMSPTQEAIESCIEKTGHKIEYF